jgi:uncharacterized membrane protein YfcA
MFFLVACAFLAGFVDSIVGGGGLIQVPALFVFLPPQLAAVVPMALGANKFSSICGTSVAAAQYASKVAVPWRAVLPAAGTAFIFSLLGARAVSMLNPKFVKPLILLLLVGVAIYTSARKGKPARNQREFSSRARLWISLAIGCAIGFYDGFFGPGTGTFLIILFVTVFGFDFLVASASAKAVNLATNIAAVSWFAFTGNIPYRYAIPMAAANVAGAAVGSRLAILKGSEFVRRFFLGVVLVLITRFAYEMAVQP